MFCLWGCNSLKEDNTNDTVKYHNENVSTAYVEEMINQCKGKTYDELITNTYDEQLIDYFKSLSGYAFHTLSSYVPFDTINTKYPIQCLRKSENGRIYAIYKTNKGLFYVFFINLVKESATFDYAFTYGTLMSKNLYSKDFENVLKGNTIEIAEEIEPAIKSLREIYESNVPIDEDNGLLYFTLLLNDGELCFTIDRKDNKIISKEFYRNYSFNHNDIFEIDPIFNIDLKDLPQSNG